MQHALIIHEVEPYPAWKTIFDQAADIEKARRKNQLPIAALRQRCKQDRPLLGMVFTDNARRFFESSERVEIRKKAGVNAPDFIYLQEIDRGAL